MKKTLIHLPNWLGDSIMAMPAVASLVKSSPPDSVVGLCKPAVRSIWSVASVPLPLIEIPATLSATLKSRELLRPHDFGRCIVLPNSWRGAFIPFTASIPVRRGARGHWRSLILTDVVDPTHPPKHLSRDYATLLGVPEEMLEDSSLITVPDLTRDRIREILSRLDRVSAEAPLFGILPGAARGPSKRWSTESFISTGKMLQAELGGSIVVLGAGNERQLCQEIADGIGGRAWSFAGALSFLEGLGMMESCQALISNDSGGMHMAWALGRPLVAIFGITDPTKTGPLGSRSCVLQKSERRSRSVPRDCPEARAALARITPLHVMEAVASVIAP
jgi:heptosyltransferase-2